MSQSSHIKGIRIQTINLVMLGLSLVMFAAVLYTTHLVSSIYDSTLKAIYNFVEWERSARTINAASDYLTDQVKLFGSTKDRQYADNYFRELYETKRRENTLNTLAEHKLHSFDESHDCDLKKAIALSDILTEREIYAIRLLADAEGMVLTAFPQSVAAVRVAPADKALEPGARSRAPASCSSAGATRTPRTTSRPP